MYSPALAILDQEITRIGSGFNQSYCQYPTISLLLHGLFYTPTFGGKLYPANSQSCIDKRDYIIPINQDTFGCIIL